MADTHENALSNLMTAAYRVARAYAAAIEVSAGSGNVQQLQRGYAEALDRTRGYKSLLDKRMRSDTRYRVAAGT